MAQNSTQPTWDAAALATQLGKIAEQSQRLVQDFLLDRPDISQLGMGDVTTLPGAFIELTTKMMTDPAAIARTQIDLFNDSLRVWQTTAERLMGHSAGTEEPPQDKRFKHPDWTESVVFNFVKESYLIWAKAVLAAVRGVGGLDPATARKVDFYTRQFIDALSPSNFVATNPEVLAATLETGGQNLLRGLENLLDDLQRGKGRLSITMTDMGAFRLGDNIAATPGKVVFQNDLMQLIQYTPATPDVRRRPLLIVPPWINKFYVLDLQPKNSFIRWAVDQGHTVFVISWVNPDEKLAEKSFEDYMQEGPLAALDAIEMATAERSVNAVGYCLGGTLLASTLAYMTARGDERIASASYFVTLVDFADAGDMAVFIDDEQLASLDERMKERGYLEAQDMAMSFNMLRSNDLIWSFVVRNYLLGKEHLPFDLAKPGGIRLYDVPLNLTQITTPTFILSTREDHIAPWKSTYAATHLYKGPVKFVLSASGHMAGVINGPGGKYGHWTNDDLPATPDQWFSGAAAQQGSWWPIWDEWVTGFASGQMPARQPGDGSLTVIENAPGSYARVRSDA